MHRNLWGILGATIGFVLGIVPTMAQTPNVAGAVFVMTNSTDRGRGNEVGMFSRLENGDLRFVGYFPTGRLEINQPQLGSGPAPTAQIAQLATGGAQPRTSAQSDGLGSTNSLLLSQNNRCLFAVNGGSNSISSFRVLSRGLELQTVIPSRGILPASLATSQNLLYVLNAGLEGNIAGFRVLSDCRLTAFTPNSNPNGVVSLADFTDSFPIPFPGEVMTTPAQISFTPDGSRLLLSVKGGDANIVGGVIQSLPSGRMVVFPVNSDGGLGAGVATPFNASAGRGAPFSFIVNSSRQITVVHGSTSSINSYTIGADNRLSLAGNVAPVPIPDFAPCWIVRFGNFVYASSGGIPNAASPQTPGSIFPTISPGGAINGYRISGDGTLEPLNVRVPYPDPAQILNNPAATGNNGIDLAVIGNFLYFLQPRTGMIGRLTINGNGTLSNLTNFGGFAPGLEPAFVNNPGINDFLEPCYVNNSSPECLLGSMQGITGF